MPTKIFLIHFLAAVLLIAACGSKDQNTDQFQKKQLPESKLQSTPSALVQKIKIVKQIPHDTNAFTQGLLVSGGYLYESTGLNGKSSVRRIDILTGKVLDRRGLDAQYFGEGLAVVDNYLFQITWLNQRGFVYDIKTLKSIREFKYVGEGWGLTSDGSVLFKSNGTHVITVHNPDDFSQIRALSVTLNGKMCDKLNELEWVDGELWANVWQTEQIVRIDPETGVVSAVIDCSEVIASSNQGSTADVMNGIAYDSVNKNIYITGKNWRWMYLIELL